MAMRYVWIESPFQRLANRKPGVLVKAMRRYDAVSNNFPAFLFICARCSYNRSFDAAGGASSFQEISSQAYARSTSEACFTHLK